jgi:hypothetical protein
MARVRAGYLFPVGAASARERTSFSICKKHRRLALTTTGTIVLPVFFLADGALLYRKNHVERYLTVINVI